MSSLPRSFIPSYLILSPSLVNFEILLSGWAAYPSLNPFGWSPTSVQNENIRGSTDSYGTVFCPAVWTGVSTLYCVDLPNLTSFYKGMYKMSRLHAISLSFIRTLLHSFKMSIFDRATILSICRKLKHRNYFYRCIYIHLKLYLCCLIYSMLT